MKMTGLLFLLSALLIAQLGKGQQPKNLPNTGEFYIDLKHNYYQ